MSTPPTETQLRRAARDSGRHPAGRRLIPAAIVTLSAAGLLATGTGIASASPNQQHPETREEPLYCAPGTRPVTGAYRCEEIPDLSSSFYGPGLGDWLAEMGGRVIVVLQAVGDLAD